MAYYQRTNRRGFGWGARCAVLASLIALAGGGAHLGLDGAAAAAEVASTQDVAVQGVAERVTQCAWSHMIATLAGTRGGTDRQLAVDFAAIGAIGQRQIREIVRMRLNQRSEELLSRGMPAQALTSMLEPFRDACLEGVDAPLPEASSAY